MSDITSVIETMEHQWMRAWVSGATRTMKAITSKSFVLLTASKPPMLLDRPSWLEAAAKRYRISSYRFGDLLVSRRGDVAVFAAPLVLEGSLDGRDWSGAVFVTDLWRKRRLRRGWKLEMRIVSSTDEKPDLAKAIKSLQLWR